MKIWENIKKKKEVYLRFVIQLVFFIFMPSAFTASFAGAKYIVSQIGLGDAVALSAFLKVLIGLSIFTIIFGRFFCGYACAFGFFGDLIYSISSWIFKKRKKKMPTIPTSVTKWLKNIKYVLLVLILVLCFLGVYGNLSGTSPWDVFSMVRSLNFRLSEYMIGTIMLILIIVGMALCERFFCRFLCPMGAIFALLPVLPIFSLRRNRENCIPKCSACTRKCPVDLALSADNGPEVYGSGECIQCQKCIQTCPKKNIHCQASQKLSGKEIWFTLLKAVLLFVVMIFLNI